MGINNQKKPLLRIRGITKNFTGTLALDHIDLDIYSGEVHALLGENGAGKSTLIKILSGVYDCHEGNLNYQGKDIGLDITKLSLSVIHQDLGLVDEMTVAENIAIITGYPQTKIGTISWQKTRQNAIDLLAKMDCAIDPDAKVLSLSAAEKSMVAISRALAKKTNILILDEPTATLPQNDVDKLFHLIRTLQNENIAIVYVTHRLDEVFQISKKVTVMRNGKIITTNNVEDTNPKRLIVDIVGKEVAQVNIGSEENPDEESVLEIDSLITGFVGPVSIKLHRGEILALFGLRGAGHHEVGRCLWGIEKLESGLILINGKAVRLNSPEDSIRNGIGFVSSKRHEESMAASFSVRENIYINPTIGDGKKLKLLNINNERHRCKQTIERFSIKPRDGERIIGTLSGGNQQKVVVARWFEAGSNILILEEPTIGVDVGAKADIYNMMGESLKNGKSIILITSDREEVTRLSHRAIVFNKGGVVGEVSQEQMAGNLLSELAAGAVKL